MADRWETYRQKASEAVSKVIDATQRFTKIGRIRVDIVGLKKEIDHQFTLLGKHVYEAAKEDKLASLVDDETVKAAVAKVDELKAKIAAKEAEIEELRKPKVEEKVEEAPAAEAAPAEAAATAEAPPEEAIATETVAETEPAEEEKPQETEKTSGKKSSES